MNNLSHQEQWGGYPHRARHVKYMKNKALIPEEFVVKIDSSQTIQLLAMAVTDSHHGM